MIINTKHIILCFYVERSALACETQETTCSMCHELFTYTMEFMYKADTRSIYAKRHDLRLDNYTRHMITF
jgi:hypothetical protein